MTADDELICFKRCEFRGSRYRCLLFSSLRGEQIADVLNPMLHPFATIDANARRMPRGFLEPKETRLTDSPEFLSDDHRKKLLGWWLKIPRQDKVPNWDFVSEATIENRPGILLVEAKAHERELKADDACGAGPDNAAQIAGAIAEAASKLNERLPGWALRATSHYQLSNRFAWAWKLAEMGVPVVLVYLGFLDAREMATNTSSSFTTLQEWRSRLFAYASGIVPSDAWDNRIEIDGTPLVALTSVMDVHVLAQAPAPRD